MTGYSEFELQARRMRDELVAVATQEADRWLAATLAMLQRCLTSMPCDAEADRTVGKPPIPADGEKHGRNRKSLASVTRAAIASITTETFDSVQLRHLIGQSIPMEGATPRANLSNLLKRMVSRDEIDLVEQGTGSRPSRYRKKGVEPMKTVESQG